MSFDLWTLGFQAVNVLVLVWLLHRFFWKPVAGIIAARKAAAATLLAEAEAKCADAETALAEVETTRAALAAEREAHLAAAREEAEAARKATMEAARAKAEALKDEAAAARLRADAAHNDEAQAEAGRLAVVIAGKLMARLDGAAVEAAFLAWLVEGLAALTERDHQALAEAKLEVVGAAKADSATEARIAAAIEAALGAPAEIAFRADPALIAGFELHSPHLSLRNSWRADLARIAAALTEEDRDLSDAA